MPADKYRFISPGVFITEVDQSQIPNLDTAARGPIIIGRALKGPSFQPVRVTSMDQFEQIFGSPVPGGSGTPDAWRNQGFSTPMYGTYAAEAYLRNNQPVTYVRVLGAQSADATTTIGTNGWRVPAMSEAEGASGEGGTYGLFVWPSASDTLVATPITGTLAAIWYCNAGASVALSGTINRGSTTAGDANHVGITASNNCGIRSETSGYQFKVAVKAAGATNTSQVKTFNFTRNSSNYIRNVFNTDPTKLNSTLYAATDGLEDYILGPTYERAVASLSASVNTPVGTILRIGNLDGTLDGGDFTAIKDGDGGPPVASTGWFISQDVNEATTFVAERDAVPLFKVKGLHASGQNPSARTKVAIRDIRFPTATEQAANPYPSFTLEIRVLGDTDRKRKPLETFTDLNLNPNSPNYIAARVGDKYLEYDSTNKRITELGDYENLSSYVRVEMHSGVKAGGADSSLMPFGVLGPDKFKDININGINGKGELRLRNLTGSIADVTASAFASPKGLFAGPALLNGANHDADTNVPSAVSGSVLIGISGAAPTDLKLRFPGIPLVANASDSTGKNNQTDAYFGVDLQESAGSKRASGDIVDLTYVLPQGPGSAFKTYQYVFTLDHVSGTCFESGVTTPDFVYVSGSRAAATAKSITAISGAAYLVNKAKINKFTTVMAGGFDGLDIREMNPFRNRLLDGTDTPDTQYGGATEALNYAHHSIQRAINIISDAEVVDFNLATIPGITNQSLTENLVDACEERGDSLAIIDIQHDYQPRSEGLPASYPAMPNLTNAMNTWRSRSLDSSYGCAFFPWVQTRDRRSGQLLWIPPSVPALGTVGSSAARSELWFAPAGFNRGGLSQGAAGLPVVAVRKKLTSKDRDELYDNRVNPIASFPSEGIVIFGQKTLQVEKSALDRINVRRLLIHLKKRVSIIANSILFDQNLPATWARFKGQVEPLLSDVKTRFGLTDYKVVLDEKTTTPDLIDRNILYAKIFLKPARAIEYIAIDFFITSTGASFED